MIPVLVVDDHPVLRSGLEAVLRAEPGFSCVGAAADGDEMERVLSRAHPAVVVLDRRLDHEDGFDLCRALRARPDAPPSSSADVARAHVAHAIVEKSAPIEDLFDAVRLAARERAAPTA